jgi:hypothetical protein
MEQSGMALKLQPQGSPLIATVRRALRDSEHSSGGIEDNGVGAKGLVKFDMGGHRTCCYLGDGRYQLQRVSTVRASVVRAVDGRIVTLLHPLGSTYDWK